MNKLHLGRSGISGYFVVTDERPATITIVVYVTKEGRSEDQANVALEEETEQPRKRSLMEKGYSYQLNLKTSNLKAKKCEMVNRMRGTLLK